MKYVYDPYILKRQAEGRVFFVNATMPFECFLDCFRFEQPFFLVSQLDDGRIAIIPNSMCIPLNLLQVGYWPHDLFPQDFEYVTLKNGIYPVIMTAHPVKNFQEWFVLFERNIVSFAKMSMSEFLTTSFEFTPLKETKGKFPIREEMPA